MAIVLIIITSGVVCLRFFEKLQWNTKLQIDDYIIGICLVRSANLCLQLLY